MNTIFHILYPGGNTTALVETPTERPIQPHIAQEIMAEEKSIEQVGFFETPTTPTADCRLQMMGGEFCVNATRSAAFWFAKKNARSEVTIETSGLHVPLKVQIIDKMTVIHMPGDIFLGLDKQANYAVVTLMGIRHIILNGFFDTEEARNLIEEWKDDFAAVGIIYFKKIAASFCIDPFVWVKETNSFVRETGCGSGSIALAISQLESGISSFEIVQPSGSTYSVEITKSFDRTIKSITLKGEVEIMQ